MGNLSFNQRLTYSNVWIFFGLAITLWFYGSLLNANLSKEFILIFASFSWGIYSTDHFFDSNSITIAQPRRLYFKRNKFTFLFFVLLLVTLASIGTISTFTANDWKFGVVLGALTLTHFLIQYFLKQKKLIHWTFKELFLSFIIFCALLGFPILHQTQPTNSFKIIFLGISLYGLIISNLLIFSVFDAEMDLKEGFVNLQNQKGVKFTEKLIYTFLILGTVSSSLFYLCFGISFFVWLIFMIQYGVLFYIYIQKEKYMLRDRFRFWGDFVFSFPIVYYWIA
jgi:hypothetical protein